MKITHIISSMDYKSGGTTSALNFILEGLKGKVSTHLITSATVKTHILQEYVTYDLITNRKSIFNNYFIWQKILRNASTDIFHGHGIWEYQIHLMSRISKKKQIPYIISPHGMLEKWCLDNKKIKKKIALFLYQIEDLQNSFCVHALTKNELFSIRNLGVEKPIAIIPNGIDISIYFPKVQEFKKDACKNILFLSRIHTIKGLEILIEAWRLISPDVKKNWKIRIVGPGEPNYIKKLKYLIANYSFSDEIQIYEPKFGSEKIKEFHNTDLFILPSYSEGFPIAVLEALSCGIPVITTKGAPLEDLVTHNAGWWIDIGVEPLAKALTEAMKLSDEERIRMGLNGRKLVEEKYSIESVADKMIKLYEWILNKSEKPEFVYE